ncbi:glycoside hydrolase family 1 protein [Propionispora vibrioides]|uniref:Aryl-phospho-beta-glucosidase n=1 Tax=Propionispora vibrioides TaxID=112903 RepID=A0A1H8VJ03_9FIRM|nr:glycoside hydrolase family 1 protein [Propionispora vibrioides]SEP14858.1 aryl-phospho-beta-glucosidase [Propionispora vibrioides]
MNKKYNFPPDFWWGAATSGPQSEGRFYKKHRNIFDYWFDIEPEAFFNRIGPNVTSNFFNSYREDIRMMKEIGLNSVRTSIQWTRLIKDFETGEVDPEGAAFYHQVIDEFLKNGITPVMNLHHFDLPIDLYEKYGGWESKIVVELFVLFAQKCFALFGDKVKQWVTFNEPMVVVEGQYLYTFHYPNLVDGLKAVQVLYNLNLASAKTIAAFRDTDCAKQGGKIGIVLNLTPSYPRSDHEADVKAADFVDNFFNRSFLDPAVKGEFSVTLVDVLEKDGVLWESTEKELAIIKRNTVDFLGVNYYQPRRAKAKESLFDESCGWMPDKYFDNYQLPGCRMNPYRQWEIYPQAIYDIAINLRDQYDNIPWYLSENGMGVEGEEQYTNSDGYVEDDYRIDFYEEHLGWLHKGMEEGANCFGFHAWTPIDCWSWSNAYKNRYGYIALDLATQRKTIKKSGYWIKQVAQNNGF